MTFRKIVSLSILLSFVILAITGLLEYFLAHSKWISSLHTLFGLIFIFGIGFHFYNNYRSVRHYLKSKWLFILSTLVILLMVLSYLGLPPTKAIYDFGSKLRSNQKQEVDLAKHEIIEVNTLNENKLSFDLMRGEHYWHPQMAIWTEDLNGEFLETIFISKATAQGLFFGGRSKDNFKEFDENKEVKGDDYRRVNALPIWSHKRGIQYSDGMYVPTNDEPMPDALTGATISENAILNTSTNSKGKFKLRVEINVAFDDNEFYSEYDFPDDDQFHAGTGQLGQPSIIFESIIDSQDGQDYYLMKLIGHGHHSGQDGMVQTDMSTLTTALDIIERIVVGVKSESSAIAKD